MRQTILLVDDERDILELLKYNLEKEGYFVRTATDGASALSAARSVPDLIVLDIMLPEIDGWEVAKTLRSTPETRSIPIVFLTAKDSEVDEVLGLELGAEDYIRKPVNVRLLIARIRKALRQRTAAPGKEGEVVIVLGDIVIHPLNYLAVIENHEVHFPRKEFELLLYLVRHPNRVIRRETLLNEVWGENVVVVDRTVDVHIRKVREKLGVHAHLIETVKGVGYRLKKDFE